MRIVILLMALLLAGCTPQREPDVPRFPHREQTVALPLQWLYTGDMGGLPLVNVQLAGPEQTRSSWWLVDTGSSHNVVSPRLVEALKLTQQASSNFLTVAGQRSAPYVGLPPLQLGDLRLEGQSASAVDMSNLGVAQGLPVEGILGVPAMRHLAVTIDYPARTLTLTRQARPAAYNLPHTWLPFRLEGGVPVARLETAPGRFGDFILDTGNAATLVMFPNHGRQFGNITQSNYRIIEVADLGGSVLTGLSLLPSLRMGRLEIRHIPVYSPASNKGFGHLAGTIGNALFIGKSVTWDFPGQQLLISMAGADTRLPGSFGFLLGLDNTIQTVIPGSPAAQAGFKPGDRILALDGVDMQQGGAHAIWRHLHHRNVAGFTLSRQGQTLPIRLERQYFLPVLPQ
ncbi:MAG: aspartyl protease family protein [Thiothrix sp.]|nr:aspartyl protease family protein [Thiothrix sp.]HPQ97159.1 aspartyl protease family protein [Thiolinea sp.]